MDTPFSSTPWPEISFADQEEILELLCSLLRPIGRYRRDHVQTSKGKRAAKKAKARKDSATPETSDLKPPAPELIRMIDVGLNTITKTLTESTSSKPAEPCVMDKAGAPDSGQDVDSPYTMVFVARGDQQSTFNCHFPKMVAASTTHMPPGSRTRLIGFSKTSSERLSKCLNVARVSSVAVRRGAPGAGPLWDFVSQRVKPLEAPWLETEAYDSYKRAKINSMETTVGPKKIRTS